MVIWVFRIPRTSYSSGFTAVCALTYPLVSVLLNVTLTCMICYRLLWHAETVKKYLGDQHASPYFTITMLLVESTLPYTISEIAFLVSCGLGSQTMLGFARVSALMMVGYRSPV